MTSFFVPNVSERPEAESYEIEAPTLGDLHLGRRNRSRANSNLSDALTAQLEQENFELRSTVARLEAAVGANEKGKQQAEEPQVFALNDHPVERRHRISIGSDVSTALTEQLERESIELQNALFALEHHAQGNGASQVLARQDRRVSHSHKSSVGSNVSDALTEQLATENAKLRSTVAMLESVASEKARPQDFNPGFRFPDPGAEVDASIGASISSAIQPEQKGNEQSDAVAESPQVFALNDHPIYAEVDDIGVIIDFVDVDSDGDGDGHPMLSATLTEQLGQENAELRGIVAKLEAEVEAAKQPVESDESSRAHRNLDDNRGRRVVLGA